MVAEGRGLLRVDHECLLSPRALFFKPCTGVSRLRIEAPNAAICAACRSSPCQRPSRGRLFAGRAGFVAVVRRNIAHGLSAMAPRCRQLALRHVLGRPIATKPSGSGHEHNNANSPVHTASIAWQTRSALGHECKAMPDVARVVASGARFRSARSCPSDRPQSSPMELPCPPAVQVACHARAALAERQSSRRCA